MKELTLEATINNVTAVTEFVEAELEALDCSMKAQVQIDIAIDELFSNIAKYAYEQGPGPATIRLEYDEAIRQITIFFIDEGKPFNPLEAEDPDITESAEERSIGGLGLLMVKKQMDDVGYEYKDDKNILYIKKTI